MTEKIGIYGGTFSPPHLGHRLAAECFLKEAALDRLLVIPACVPPHKASASIVSPEERLAMTTLAFEDMDKAEVSALEITRQGKSYTYDTLTALSGEDRELYFFCGTDMLLTFDRWYRFRDIFSLCTLAVGRREYDPEMGRAFDDRIAFFRREYGARIMEIPLTPIPISSTDVRNAVRDGKTKDELSEMIAPAVADYIFLHGLYRHTEEK